ncbi:hypothetical protein Bbelb_422310 [Branchiostoma belcheri]|nr:hypothetical protein Bbelb_422310 [Branchiostoma belcheri]
MWFNRTSRPLSRPMSPAARPPAPLYVRRAGLRFWCTRRILDWQRQALRAGEDPDAVLKPVREYGEESASKNTETGESGLKGHDLAGLNAGCLPAEHVAKRVALTNHTLRQRKGDATSQLDQPHFLMHVNTKIQATQGDTKRPIGPREHSENNKDHENDREHALYENDKEHGHYENDGEHGHSKDNEEHKYFQYDKNHARYENDKEHALYENDGEHEHYEDHKYYQYDKNHARYENDREHALYENDEEQSNLSTHVYADLDPEFRAAQDEIKNATARPFYEMDIMDVTDAKDNQQEQPFYEINVASCAENVFYNMDGDKLGKPNSSVNTYEDLDADFLAAKDEIRHAAAQPFYEMDITPADEEQKQPFYKMDVTAAKETEKQEQPFYEINVASTEDNNEEPTPSGNTYENLDPDFLAAQDVVDRRHDGKEPTKVGNNDGPRCSQNCRVFCRSRARRMVALCVGAIIAGIAATTVAVILNQHSVRRVRPNENLVVPEPHLTSDGLHNSVYTSARYEDVTSYF